MNAALPIAATRPEPCRLGAAAATLCAEEFSERLVRAAASSRQPTRDLALAHVLLGTGLTPIEIACLQIADYLREDGTVRARAAVRCAVARNARMRPLLWTCPAVTTAVDAYLAQRRLIFGGLTPDRPYLGFDPRERLFPSTNGDPVKTGHAMADRRTGLHERFLRLLRAADLAGYSTFYARKVFAARLYASGASLQEVALLLGVGRKARVKRMIDDVPMRETGSDRLARIVAQLL